MGSSSVQFVHSVLPDSTNGVSSGHLVTLLWVTKLKREVVYSSTIWSPITQFGALRLEMFLKSLSGSLVPKPVGRVEVELSVSSSSSSSSTGTGTAD